MLHKKRKNKKDKKKKTKTTTTITKNADLLYHKYGAIPTIIEVSERTHASQSLRQEVALSADPEKNVGFSTNPEVVDPQTSSSQASTNSNSSSASKQAKLRKRPRRHPNCGTWCNARQAAILVNILTILSILLRMVVVLLAVFFYEDTDEDGGTAAMILFFSSATTASGWIAQVVLYVALILLFGLVLYGVLARRSRLVLLGFLLQVSGAWTSLWYPFHVIGILLNVLLAFPHLILYQRLLVKQKTTLLEEPMPMQEQPKPTMRNTPQQTQPSSSSSSSTSSSFSFKLDDEGTNDPKIDTAVAKQEQGGYVV